MWNGRLESRSWCSDTGRRVYFYPSEYLTSGIGWNGVSEDLNPLVTRPNGVKEYRISDHLASNRVVLDQHGNPVTTIDYDPWGTPIPMAGPVAGVRRTYNEEEIDRESGLGDLGVRRYDPITGRFISVDALWESQPGLTPYAYADLQPTGKTDPDGLQARRLEDDKRPSNPAIVPEGGGSFRGTGGGGRLFGRGGSSASARTQAPPPQNSRSGGNGQINRQGTTAAQTEYPRDWASKNTDNKSATFNSEGEARTLARTKVGANPVTVEPNKLRSRDGVWQYRAKPNDVNSGHVHLERLNPNTGEVLVNWHLIFPPQGSR